MVIRKQNVRTKYTTENVWWCSWSCQMCCQGYEWYCIIMLIYSIIYKKICFFISYSHLQYKNNCCTIDITVITTSRWVERIISWAVHIHQKLQWSGIFQTWDMMTSQTRSLKLMLFISSYYIDIPCTFTYHNSSVRIH